MNYFAHGFRFEDRPWFLAGTAVPDWLSVADRKVRLRAREVAPSADGTGSPQAELAAGVLWHLEDDRWFHHTPAFIETSGELTRLYRQALGADNGFRPGFLGHVSTELLLDALLIEAHPRRLDAYYEALGQIDPEVVQRAVNAMARDFTSRLASFIPRFRRSQFLRDYTDPGRLLVRLNQVMRRIKLSRLPPRAEEVLRAARPIVRRRMGELLPPERWGRPSRRRL